MIEFKGKWEDGLSTSTEHTRVDIDVLALLDRLVVGFVRVLVLFLPALRFMWGFLLRDSKGTKSTGGVDVVHIERDGAVDTDTDLVVQLDSDYSHCSICYQAFTTDMERTDQTSRELLPVLGLCEHYFCHGCIIAWFDQGGTQGCPKCNQVNQFVPTSPVSD